MINNISDNYVGYISSNINFIEDRPSLWNEINGCGDIYFKDNYKYLSGVVGCNTIDSMNIIVSDKIQKSSKEILCHELLHNKYPRTSYYHDFIYKMGHEGVCYK